MTQAESINQNNEETKQQNKEHALEDSTLSEKPSSTVGDKEKDTPKNKSEYSELKFYKEKNTDDEIDVETYSDSDEGSLEDESYSLERSTESPEIEVALPDNQKSNFEGQKEENVTSINCKDVITKSDLNSNRAPPIILNGKKLYRKFISKNIFSK